MTIYLIRYHYFSNMPQQEKKALVRNLPVRIFFVILALLPIAFLWEFYTHITAHFTGSILPNIITQQWIIVVLNIVIFLTFLIPLGFRRKIDWKEYGLVTAFFISLFVEMYGIPLTVFFAAKALPGTETTMPNVLFKFAFLGVNISFSHAMVYGTVLMLLGTVIIILGWVTLYRGLRRNGSLVTDGIYSYSRHPQYLGFVLIILGWLVGWPTFLTVIFAPILILMYIRVCRLEEAELSAEHDYDSYKKKVPFLI